MLLLFRSRYSFTYDLWSMDLSLTIQQYFSKSSLFCFFIRSQSVMDSCDVTVKMQQLVQIETARV